LQTVHMAKLLHKRAHARLRQTYVQHLKQARSIMID
jgi:hypothetical protein